MTYTLGQITHKVASQLQILSEGKATGGSTTTIIDTSLRTEADDYWNGGSAWIWYDAGALGADPEYSYSVISDFVNSTSTITLRDTLPAAVASGDRYSVCRRVGKDTWIDIIIQKVNDAARDIGPIPQVDVTTVTIAQNQKEYSLPITAGMRLKRVFNATTVDANDNDWVEIYNWEVEHATPGNQPVLILPQQEVTGYGIKLDYLDYHPEMQISTDVLSDMVPLDLVVFPAALACMYWRKELFDGTDKWDAVIGRTEAKVAELKLSLMVEKPHKPGKIMRIGWREQARPGRWYPGDRNPR